MIDLPKPNENETIGQYVNRLLSDKIITTTEIQYAVRKYNNNK